MHIMIVVVVVVVAAAVAVAVVVTAAFFGVAVHHNTGVLASPCNATVKTSVDAHPS